MAIPAIPTGFAVQQGDGRAFTSWSIVAGATSYSVQRSTDGITYSVVGSPTTPYYLDTTVTVNTNYYYQVASVNASGTSSYSSPMTVIPTLSGKLSLGEIRLRSQQRADRVNSNFVTMPEWNFFINQSYYELYDILITCYEDYYVAPRLAIVTTSASSYDLPTGANYSSAPAFYKLFGVDLGLNSSTDAWVTLKKFDFISRNRYVYPQLTSPIGYFSLEYRLVGSQIMFIPTPVSSQYFGLWYFPRLTTLLQDTDVMDGISGWTQYVIVRAAKYALDKEESDTQKLDSELMYLKQRIEESAMNRDAGQPDTISDTRRSNNWAGGWNDGNWGGI